MLATTVGTIALGLHAFDATIVNPAHHQGDCVSATPKAVLNVRAAAR
jgi:hypothetical protein